MNVSKHIGFGAALLAVASLAVIVAAQTFPMHRGNPERTGLPGDVTTPTTENYIGRGFLRWWDPLLALPRDLDNDEAGTVPTPNANWTRPPVPGEEYALNYVQNQNSVTLGLAPYRFALTAPARDNARPTQVQPGFALRNYAWTYSGLVTGRSFEAYVNIPIGPTRLFIGSTAERLFYPQRYYVYEVSGVQGGPFVEIVDTFARGGGYTRLFANRTLTVTGTTLTVRLYNTSPRNPDGSFLDPTANPGQELVYADAARLVDITSSSGGNYQASPVVNELTVGSPTIPWRTVASRNLELLIGSLNRRANIGVTTSFAYDGQFIDGPLTPRRNLVWSWPARRPFAETAAEETRFENELDAWVSTNVDEPNQTRADQKIVQDNLSGGVTFSGSFAQDLTAIGIFGVDALSAPVSGTTNGGVTYRPDLPTGNWFVEVWLPEANTADTLARGARYAVRAGTTTLSTLTLNQAAFSNGTSGGGGWIRIPGQPAEGFPHDRATGATLSVLLTNVSGTPGDNGRRVYADAVRFVRAGTADLSVSSTPAFVRTQVRTSLGGPLEDRDVVVVAMENGRLYCIDAQGNETTGVAPAVYWTFPSERTSPNYTDPNHDLNEDGPDGMAEMPTGFDLSSALVRNVNGRDVLFIGSQNGRVYAIEMAGRGDGTTRRLWTYPDDFNPLTPNGQRSASTLGAIRGSVAYGEPLVGGVPTPTIYVPTSQGRLYALNAEGNPATKTTSVRWTYPELADPVLGPIQMTPVVAYGNVYFGATEDQTSAVGRIYAVNEETGSGAVIVPDAFARFGNASPVAVPGSQIPGGANPGVDSLFFADSAGRMVRIDPLGNILWSTTELGSAASAGLVFTHMEVLDTFQVLQPSVPVVIVPTANGRLQGFRADGVQNIQGGLRAWSYQLESAGTIASPAVGGVPGPALNPAALRRSWLYAADASGLLYGFNHDPARGDNDQIITPGGRPGRPEPDPNDPSDEINDIMENASLALVPGGVFNELRQELLAGTLTYADVVAAATGDAVVRPENAFEYGETLYMVWYDLPDTGGNPDIGNYILQYSPSTPATVVGLPVQQVQQAGRPGWQRDVVVQRLAAGAPAGAEMVALEPFALVPTGGNSVPVGPGGLDFRAVIAGQGASSAPREVEFAMANPLGVGLPVGPGGQVGVDTNPALNLFPDNRVGSFAAPNRVVPVDRFTPIIGTQGPVGHGQTGSIFAAVYDRSLMTLIFGPGRGLANVRFLARDTAWVKRNPTHGDNPNPETDLGVIAPLDTTIYNDFEDYPVEIPNRSLDYPNIDRSNLSVAKEVAGDVQNPIFLGVTLTPPAFTQADLDAYNSDALAYNAGLIRTLADTRFDIRLDVPLYQPPSFSGYGGTHLVFVDSGSAGFDSLNDAANQFGNPDEPYRAFTLGVNVGASPRIDIGNPTIDLGGLPMGAGFNTPGTGQVAAPWASTVFSPWQAFFNTGDNQIFQTFSAFNNGNVNLRSVRVAKSYTDQVGLGLVSWPVRLASAGQHELAWLDAALHLRSDLDPLFSSTGISGIDPNGRVALQKPRVGDVGPTRLNRNPIRRVNPILGVLETSTLVDATAFPPGDPRIGVSVPLGTPSGSYVNPIYLYDENSGGVPGLDPSEPFTDPPMALKFDVREARLTNRETLKTSPMVERLIAGGEPFAWANTQPAALRAADGSMLVAWSSDRLQSGAPNRTPGAKVAADVGANPQWRIYVAAAPNNLANVGVNPNPVPLGDLNTFGALTNFWFESGTNQPLPAVDATSLFTVLPGQTVVPGTEQFYAPAFPASGVHDALAEPTSAGKTAFGTRTMAYVGSAMTRLADGTPRQVEQIFVSRLRIDGFGAVTQEAVGVIPYDRESRKSQPSVVEQGGLVHVFYTVNAGGLSQIVWNSSSDLVNWSSTQTLNLGANFESVGSPSAVGRRFRNGNGDGRVDILFTAKLRGRPNSELFLAQLEMEDDGRIRGRSREAFPVTISPLDLDPVSQIFWAPGSDWRIDNDALPGGLPTRPAFNASDEFIDVVREMPGGGFETILDHQTRSFDRETGILSYRTVYGGTATLNTRSGSLRMSDGLVTSQTRLWVRYQPNVVRISAGTGANYRAASLLFDDRFLGVTFDANNPRRNLVSDLNFWYHPTLAITPDAPIRYDRFLLGFTRTGDDGGEATRPYLKSFRFGVQLPTPIAIDPNTGDPVSMTVEFLDSVDVDEQYFQIDPVNGRVYFMGGMEEHDVRIRYRGVDGAGNVYGSDFTNLEYEVYRVLERDEFAVPIAQVGNETALSICLDPMTVDFNSQFGNRRPGLLWLVWTSTRAGGPDIYLQTLAPRWNQTPPGP